MSYKIFILSILLMPIYVYTHTHYGWFGSGVHLEGVMYFVIYGIGGLSIFIGNYKKYNIFLNIMIRILLALIWFVLYWVFSIFCAMALGKEWI